MAASTTATTCALTSPAGGDVKAGAAARSLGLSLPALPPSPAPGVASHGLPRAAASYCRRVARNMVAMAVGEPAVVAAGATTELPEFMKAAQQEWERIEDKYAVSTLAVVGGIALWSAGGMVSAVERLPLVPGVMELVGIGYTGWFAYRNVVFKPDREAFLAKIKEIYEDIIGV